ncbi:MAG: helix-turn-helix transcriptional regulator [Paracoccaceae bacterium]
MHIEMNKEGAEMVVLTRGEFDDMTFDNAAFDAAQRDRADLTITSRDIKAILSGTLHPLTAWRKAAGFTQSQLAERAKTRTATISDIEGARIDPRISTLQNIAAALGLDVDDITS